MEKQSLAERICSLLWSKVSILSTIFMTILTIVLAIVGVFKGGVPNAFSLLPRKDEKALKTWLNSYADIARFSGKVLNF